MKVRVRVWTTLALVSFFVFTAIIFRRPPDPAFGGRLTSEWVYDLLSSDYTIRGEAQSTLQILGEPAVPQLRALLQRRNGFWEKPLVRLNGIVPFLDYRAVDANLSRARAAEMLALLGCKAQAAVPDLIVSLAYPQSAAESERALLRIGTFAVPALERALSSRHTAVRIHSARLLRECSSAASIPALIESTRDTSPEVRKEAALSLGALAGRAVPARRFPEKTALAPLLSLSRDHAPQVRAAAFQALGEIGEAAPEVLAVLEQGLPDQSPAVSFEAAKALWLLHPDSRKIVPVLITILDKPERWRAAYLLGDMGLRAAPAVPALIRLLIEEQVPRPFRTPPSSAFALGKIGRPAISELAPLLQNPDPRIRINALMAFGFMGESGRAAVPQLIEVLRDKNAEVRHTAALTLASLRAEPEQIVAGLSDCLRAEDIYMRSAAAAVLRNIAPEQSWYVPAE